MNRIKEKLLPLECSILGAALQLRSNGVGEFYGFQIAKEIQDHKRGVKLTGYGTLYKALDRLESWQMLARRWEEADVAEAEGRPRRRMYRVTAKGAAALAAAEIERSSALQLAGAPS